MAYPVRGFRCKQPEREHVRRPQPARGRRSSAHRVSTVVRRPKRRRPSLPPPWSPARGPRPARERRRSLNRTSTVARKPRRRRPRLPASWPQAGYEAPQHRARSDTAPQPGMCQKETSGTFPSCKICPWSAAPCNHGRICTWRRCTCHGEKGNRAEFSPNPAMAEALFSSARKGSPCRSGTRLSCNSRTFSSSNIGPSPVDR
mmetsp:Transcript_22709/g.63365  ORF Transcript_22709/g.63365 Transcript_22709/m.63365 type:complete len:202 (+) Transcript_22709:478-1083(+)